MPEEKEKELTIEEMKALVSLSTLLPALLDKIATIEKKVSDLSSRFIDLAGRLNTMTGEVIKYTDAVNNLTKNQVDSKKLETELGNIKKALVSIDSHFNVAPVETKKEKPIEVKVPVTKKKEKEPTPEKPKKADDEVIRIVDLIIKEHRGRRTRTLTTIDVKNGFKCDDETAEKVLAWLEKNKMYNPKTHIMTFPKR